MFPADFADRRRFNLRLSAKSAGGFFYTERSRLYGQAQIMAEAVKFLSAYLKLFLSCNKIGGIKK